MARKFLYLIAGLTVLVIAVLVVLRIWADDLTEIAMVPTAEFIAPPPLEPNVYDDPEMWIARPGIGDKDASRWLPEEPAPDPSASAAPAPGASLPAPEPAMDAAVFFIHPTSYLTRDQWNAPLNDSEANHRAELFVKGMASPFNRSLDIWAPRYRQATVGAFLTEKPEAMEALDIAYGDVLEAFDYFLKNIDPKRPIVLAGHSQGAFHLRRLLRDRVAGTPLADRVAAAYVIGWPVSVEHDLPLMGLPACAEPSQPGCVMSWLSVAEPADNSMLLTAYSRKQGLDGKEVGGSGFLCTNPLTGMIDKEAAPAASNIGTLVPDFEKDGGTLVKETVPARCGDDNFLYIGAPPELELGPYVLPGNNYHLYDMLLFWGNLRADASRRVEAWHKPR